MKYILALWFIVLSLSLSACQSDTIRLDDNGKPFQSFLPPREAAFGESFYVDENNRIFIHGAELRTNEDKENIILLTYDWTIQNGQNETLLDNIRLTVKQDGVLLKPDLSLVAEPKTLVKAISAQESLQNIQQGFVLGTTGELKISFMGRESIIFIDGRPAPAYPVTLTLEPFDVK